MLNIIVFPFQFISPTFIPFALIHIDVWGHLRLIISQVQGGV